MRRAESTCQYMAILRSNPPMTLLSHETVVYPVKTPRRPFQSCEGWFCGKVESPTYEPLPALERIEYRTTRIRLPRTNGFVEWMNLHAARRRESAEGLHDE